MCLSRAGYRPRTLEQGVLHTVLRTYLETFLREAADRMDGAGLPRFVEDEFREFLTCGILAHGLARLRCEGCGLNRLLPFSCKGRGFCPSCGGCRMTEPAAHAVDAVLPPVPVRQWVLRLPHWLRYVLAWDHGLCRAVCSGYAFSWTPQSLADSMSCRRGSDLGAAGKAIGATTEYLAAGAVRSLFMLATLDPLSEAFMGAGEHRWLRLPAAHRLADRNGVWRIAPCRNTLAPLRPRVPVP